MRGVVRAKLLRGLALSTLVALGTVEAQAPNASPMVTLGAARFTCAKPADMDAAGTVIAEVRVSAEGVLEASSIRAGGSRALERVVRQCLRAHRDAWDPATRGGRPIAHAWLVPFRFRADAREATLSRPVPALGPAASPNAERDARAALIRGADACVQRCDDPPRDYALDVEMRVDEEGRPRNVRGTGAPAPVLACVARCLRELELPARDLELRAQLRIHAPVRARPVPPPPPPSARAPAASAMSRAFTPGRPRFGCPFTRQTEITSLRGEARIRVTVSAEGRLVDYTLRGGTTELRGFLRRCLEVNRNGWSPARDVRTGEPVQATWNTRYRFRSQVWN
ncbi:MAG: hypothetical protein AAGH15_10895 [Myxococcota bacterium]